MGGTRRLQVEAATRIVVDLRAQLDAWVDGTNREDYLRVVSGGPGSGKSSFGKMYAAHRAILNRARVVFVPLHQFDLKGDLESSVGEFVRTRQILFDNPLAALDGEQRLLLIFDGLDEFAQQGKVAAETAKLFVEEVEKVLRSRNYQELRVQVIISGREVVVQTIAPALRKEGQILHVLPYYLAEDERKRYEDTNNLLQSDQRQEWWCKYGVAKGMEYTNMPDELRHEQLDVITTQPLLNYLVALSYERKQVNFAEDFNLNKLYADLLKAVYERGYAKERHQAVRDMKFEQFTRVLEEIGLAVWHGDGRTTTVAEIEQHCTSSGISGLLEIFQEGAKAGVTRLLTAFYFRQHGNRSDGERTFEFTHKSFGEYLTAKRLVDALELMQEELARRKRTYNGGMDEKAALKHWAMLCGPSRLDNYLFNYLRHEVELRAENANGMETIITWQNMLCHLIGVMLRQGMPMEEISSIRTYHEMSQQALNAEEALLVALNACARVTKQISGISWPELNSAGEWIGRLQGQRTGPNEHLVLEALSYVDFNKQCMDMHDLYDANLSSANFIGARLACANLMQANLMSANLSHASLPNANLNHANLEQANLTSANLQQANVSNADLTDADLTDADLTKIRIAGVRGLNPKIRAIIKSPTLLSSHLLSSETEDTTSESPHI